MSELILATPAWSLKMIDLRCGRFCFLVAAALTPALLFAPSRACHWVERPAPRTSRLEPRPPIVRRGPENPEEMARFLDPVVQGARESLHDPGATLAVVKDGVRLRQS